MTYEELKKMYNEPLVKTCDKRGCDNEIECKGLCNTHYLRARRLIKDPNAKFQAEPKTVTFKGETHTLSEWAVITGLGATTINSRLKLGRSVEYALTTPARFKAKCDRTIDW